MHHFRRKKRPGDEADKKWHAGRAKMTQSNYYWGSSSNGSQNPTFPTKFSTLSEDFSEEKKFQAKPLKPRCNTGLKTPNPEGFWITPKSRKVRGDWSQVVRGGPPCHLLSPAGQYPLKDELLQLLPVLAKNEVPNLENHLKIEPEQDVSGPFSSPRRS